MNKIYITSTSSWLLSSILHDYPCLKQRTSTTTKSWIGANIQNILFECATMWNETERDNIVFSLPTPPLANHQMMRMKEQILKWHISSALLVD
jgi:hypothetical protein